MRRRNVLRCGRIVRLNRARPAHPCGKVAHYIDGVPLCLGCVRGLPALAKYLHTPGSCPVCDRSRESWASFHSGGESGNEGVR